MVQAVCTNVLVKNSKQIIGNKLLQFVLCMGVMLFIWFRPVPAGLDPKAWKLFAVFVFNVMGLILKPIPIGSISLISLLILITSNVMTFKMAFSGFSNETVWLIVCAFFIARGFIKTGLGVRIAYSLLMRCGKSTLGLGYGLVATDLILSASIPSLAARGGGVVYPIVLSLTKAFGSDSKTNPRKIGAYLIQVVFQCGSITSAMFLTAMAGNPMIQSFAMNVGVAITWSMWAKAAFLPGVFSLIIIPYILFKIYPPELRDTKEVATFAKEELKKLGKFGLQEMMMIGTFIFLITFWMFSSSLHISPTVTAFIGLMILVLAQVLSWDDILKEKKAWDTLIWFAAIVAMATALNHLGFTTWFSSRIEGYVSGLQWQYGFILLSIVYFYSHYFFASNVAHITSMYAPFLLLALSIGTPPVFAALVLGFFSSIFGSLTTYGSGPAPAYYGAGFVTTKDWWKLGLIFSIVNMFIWIVLGGLWWNYLGLLK